MNRFKCPWCGLETKHRRGCPGARFLWSEVKETGRCFVSERRDSSLLAPADFGERDG